MAASDFHASADHVWELLELHRLGNRPCGRQRLNLELFCGRTIYIQFGFQSRTQIFLLKRSEVLVVAGRENISFVKVKE